MSWASSSQPPLLSTVSNLVERQRGGGLGFSANGLQGDLTVALVDIVSPSCQGQLAVFQ